MIQINLLPWREQMRKRKQNRFGIVAMIAAGLGLLSSIFFHLHYASKIGSQLKRNEMLQNVVNEETAHLNDLNKQKKELVDVDNQLHFIYALRESSYRAVRVLNEISIANPDTVTLYKLVRSGPNIQVFGKAKSNLQVTQFMENIEKSNYFSQPVLTEISGKENDGSNVRDFQLKVEQQD